MATAFMSYRFGPQEFVIDFLQLIGRPPSLAARIVDLTGPRPSPNNSSTSSRKTSPATLPTLALAPNIPKNPNEKPRTAQEISRRPQTPRRPMTLRRVRQRRHDRPHPRRVRHGLHHQLLPHRRRQRPRLPLRPTNPPTHRHPHRPRRPMAQTTHPWPQRKPPARAVARVVPAVAATAPPPASPASPRPRATDS